LANGSRLALSLYSSSEPGDYGAILMAQNHKIVMYYYYYYYYLKPTSTKLKIEQEMTAVGD